MKKFEVITFKESGKYYTSAEIEVDDNVHMYDMTRVWLLRMNGGKCPGLSGTGADMHILINPIGDHSFPRLLPLQPGLLPE